MGPDIVADQEDCALRGLIASYFDLNLLIRHTATIWNHQLNADHFYYRLVHF